jgi:cell wall-associated NlpC family hydrolase
MGRHRAPVPPPKHRVPKRRAPARRVGMAKHRKRSQRGPRAAVAAIVMIALTGALYMSDQTHRRMNEPPPPRPPVATIVDDNGVQFRMRIVDHARSYVDKVRYLDGGRDPSVGLDCEGLVRQVLNDSGIKTSHRTVAQLKQWTKPIEFADLRSGDLVFYVRHVSIFVGDGQVVDVSTISDRVIEHEMWQDPYPTFGRIPV